MSKPLKPGQKAPKSGQYEIQGPRGGRTGIERTVVKGEPMPPTEKKAKNIVLLTQPSTGGNKTEKTANWAGRI